MVLDIAPIDLAGLVFQVFLFIGKNAFAIVAAAAAGGLYVLLMRRFHPEQFKKSFTQTPTPSTSTASTGRRETKGGQQTSQRVFNFMTEEDKRELANLVTDELVSKIQARRGATIDDTINALFLSNLKMGRFEGQVPLAVTKNEKGNLTAEIDTRTGLASLNLVFGNGKDEGKDKAKESDKPEAHNVPATTDEERTTRFTPINDNERGDHT